MRRERGTSTIEIIGITPLVVLVMIILAQTALALYASTSAQTGVRIAARAWSQEPAMSPAGVHSTINATVPSWLRVDAGDVVLRGPGHSVTATFDVPDIIPFADLRITRRTVMP
ncbi:hypothetical protein C6I20_13030 [Aeromicrobium sp. A1-2]|uniref:TadE family protein n=1 Tax=Aeromicrobium sp. A1-2 TaxID=2107713 RepID=UPI000E53A6E7|nr:TadE family protein [Aeromicrobium sp. A1-2]AXT86016.1 hypothetical protein C6I20_13030 [Aeromicrobium sp. A1-2]